MLQTQTILVFCAEVTSWVCDCQNSAGIQEFVPLFNPFLQCCI